MAYDKVKYDNTYIKEHYDRIQFVVPKEEKFPELLDIAVKQGVAKSKASYILEAVKKQLKEDGIW